MPLQLRQARKDFALSNRCSVVAINDSICIPLFAENQDSKKLGISENFAIFYDQPTPENKEFRIFDDISITNRVTGFRLKDMSFKRHGLCFQLLPPLLIKFQFRSKDYVTLLSSIKGHTNIPLQIRIHCILSGRLLVRNTCILVQVGCPRKRFLAINSGKASDFCRLIIMLITHSIS